MIKQVIVLKYCIVDIIRLRSNRRAKAFHILSAGRKGCPDPTGKKYDCVYYDASGRECRRPEWDKDARAFGAL